MTSFRLVLGLLALLFVVAAAAAAAFIPGSPDHCACTLEAKLGANGDILTRCTPVACGAQDDCKAVFLFWDPDTDTTWESCICAGGTSGDDVCLCFGTRDELDHSSFKCDNIGQGCNDANQHCKPTTLTASYQNACQRQ